MINARGTRMIRQSSIEELVLSLARTTPAFRISDRNLFSSPQTARKFLLGLFAPAAARRTLRSSQEELLHREVEKIDTQLLTLYKQLGPPPGWMDRNNGQ